MDRSELPFISATELAALIKSREVSPVEATEAYLNRIPLIDAKLNSYITVTADRAIADARQAEQEIVAGRYRGPMHGIPLAVKDQVYTKGILTTGGSTILKNFVPNEDATVITKLNEAGAVLMGKLNMSEFAMGDAFEHPYGRPRNPWDLSRNPGTSSSGSGAATAAFLCATSLGEDTGGSIRGPASFCGLVGIRPSWGRVSRHGVLGASWSMDQVGPISRTVSDCALTLAAIAGHDPKDEHTWDIPVPDYLATLPAGVAGLKIGVITERVEGNAVDPEVSELVVKAVAQLGELGASIQQVEIPLIALDTIPLESTGSVRLRHLLRQQILEALEGVDVLVMPTSSIPASPIPEKAGVESKQAFLEMLGGRRSFTAPFNLAHVPALSINCGFTSDDLPVGFQIAGKPFDESTVLRVAYAYEQATNWNTRRPPVS